MAPQQNSTLIDDNLDSCLSLLNLPESPILPPKHQQCQNKDRNYNANNNNNNSDDGKTNNNNSNKQAENAYEERLVDANVNLQLELDMKKQPQAQTQAQQKAAQSRLCKNKHGPANGSSHTAGRHHRSISLYGVNSTMEQGHKEIPIWLDDNELRYVSGVTNKTTCNDIIKAVIDDELRHDYNCHKNNKNNNKYDGDAAIAARATATGTAAASRDYSDYVITESWRGIERSYDGNMAILPVWRAWSRVHNELRLSLKQRRQLREPLPMRLVENAPSGSFSLLKWLKKVFGITKPVVKSRQQCYTHTPIKVPNKAREKCMPLKGQHLPDELMLVILPDQLYAGMAAPKHSKQSKQSKRKAKLYKLAKTRAAATQHRRQHNRIESAALATVSATTGGNNQQNNNPSCIRRRRKDAPLRSSIRNKLAAMHAEVNLRYEQEYKLTRQLSEKCRLFRLHNERYTTKEMELSVGQLQRNIEAYAEDIVKTEHELLELKNEIKQDISLINNLKRMTLDETTAARTCGLPAARTTAAPAPPPLTQVAKIISGKNNAPDEMQFVDNIYEFCDNNASMLV